MSSFSALSGKLKNRGIKFVLSRIPCRGENQADTVLGPDICRAKFRRDIERPRRRGKTTGSLVKVAHAMKREGGHQAGKSPSQGMSKFG